MRHLSRLLGLALASLTSTASALPQVTRTLTSEVTLNDLTTAVGAFPADVATLGATFPPAPGVFGNPALEGVTPVSVEFDFESYIEIRATMTNNTSDFVDDGLFAASVIAVAAGVTDSYGPLSLIQAEQFGNNSRSETFSPGETKTVVMFPLNNLVPNVLSIRYTPTSFAWCELLTECPDGLPPYFCSLSASGIVALEGVCDVIDSSAELEHTSRISAELELADVTASLRTFCAPPSGSPSADLRAYGSLEAGTDWLTIRVEGAPPGALVGLLGADTITTTVASPMTLCIGGLSLARSISTADPQGVSTHEISLAGFQPGDLVAFQALYRTATGFDVTPGRLLVAR